MCTWSLCTKMTKLPFIHIKPHPVQATGTELAEMRGLLRRCHCPGAADGETQIMFNYEIAVGQQTWIVLSGGFAELCFSKTFSHNIHRTLVLMFPINFRVIMALQANSGALLAFSSRWKYLAFNHCPSLNNSGLHQSAKNILSIKSAVLKTKKQVFSLLMLKSHNEALKRKLKKEIIFHHF